MASGVSARVSGLLALGNQVTTNSSACSTGTEAIADGVCAHPPRPRRAHAVRRRRGRRATTSGRASTRCACSRRSWNDEPERGVAADVARRPAASSPAPARACCCSRASRARSRAARASTPRCSAGAVNCGGHRGGGSMTAPNPDGVRRCIRAALDDAAIDADGGRRDQRPPDRDRRRPARGRRRGRAALGRRARATFPADHLDEVADRPRARRRRRRSSAVGERADAREAASCTPSINCEDVHPEIAAVRRRRSRTTTRELPELRAIAKAGFGFGDVNAVRRVRQMARR